MHLTPRAGRAPTEGLRETPDGPVAAIAVMQPPEDGKANVALETLLAKALHLPKRRCASPHGGKNRNTAVTIDGKSEDLMKQLTELMSGVSHHG